MITFGKPYRCINFNSALSKFHYIIDNPLKWWFSFKTFCHYPWVLVNYDIYDCCLLLSECTKVFNETHQIVCFAFNTDLRLYIFCLDVNTFMAVLNLAIFASARTVTVTYDFLARRANLRSAYLTYSLNMSQNVISSANVTFTRVVTKSTIWYFFITHLKYVSNV
jgi:hypothetical protein